MSKIILLHCNNPAAQEALTQALMPNPQFRVYDISEPITELVESHLHLTDDPESLALKTLVEHFRAKPEAYGLDAKAPYADILWRNISAIMRRERDVLITGLERPEDLNWLADKCYPLGEVLKLKLLVQPKLESTPTTLLDWTTDGIEESNFDRTCLYPIFGQEELAAVLADLKQQGFVK